MDENNEQKPQDGGAGEGSSQPHQHVHIFGADVSGNGGAATSHVDHAARREEWKKHKEEWKAQRKDWQYEHHAAGLFPGLLLLLGGVVALLYTMGLVSHEFWHVIAPLWPLLLIFWGASLILGRHWVARFVLFLIALVLLFLAILYGLVRSNSPVVSSLSPTVVRAIDNAQMR